MLGLAIASSGKVGNSKGKAYDDHDSHGSALPSHYCFPNLRHLIADLFAPIRPSPLSAALETSDPNPTAVLLLINAASAARRRRHDPKADLDDSDDRTRDWVEKQASPG